MANQDPDPSNGAYWWDGVDFKTNYKNHQKVKNGFHFGNPSHNIFSVQESSKSVTIYWKVRNKKTGNEVKSKARGTYQYVWESTAAHGKTIFWKHDDDYLKAAGGKGLQMKYQALVCFYVFSSSFAGADTVYDDYESYYSSLPNGVFKLADMRELRPYSLAADGKIRYSWSGKAAGLRHHVSINDEAIVIDHQIFKIPSAKAFPGETLDVGDLGLGTQVYFSANYACLENVPPSASGSAIRHKSVYLIDTKSQPNLFIKLPSLFASCIGVRLNQDRNVSFDKVEYRYAINEDIPQGVTFTEYASKGTRFFESNRRVLGTFIEPGNVYRFSIEQRPSL